MCAKQIFEVLTAGDCCGQETLTRNASCLLFNKPSVLTKHDDCAKRKRVPGIDVGAGQERDIKGISCLHDITALVECECYEVSVTRFLAIFQGHLTSNRNALQRMILYAKSSRVRKVADEFVFDVGLARVSWSSLFYCSTPISAALTRRETQVREVQEIVCRGHINMPIRVLHLFR